MASKLPPITDLKSCPYCGYDEFSIKQSYSGSGIYHRRFDGLEGADNAGMYDRLNTKSGKIAYCSRCEKAIAQWDEYEHPKHYNKFNPDSRRGGV